MSEARRRSPRTQARAAHPPPAPSPARRGIKRKAEPDTTAISSASSSSVEILDGPPRLKKTPKTLNRSPSVEILDAPPPKKLKGPSPEKRLRRFRPEPPQSFHPIFERARSQRFYVLSRERVGTPNCPEESIEVTGSTGNIYTVHIARIPTCTCPHSVKGNQCKHIIYVLSRVLRADFKYVYQLALLSSELQEILAGAPPIDAGPASNDTDAEEAGSNRKPIEGDCPICFCEFDLDEKESITWCRAACGQNVHTHCFRMWATTKCPGRESEATCPYCRSVWGVELDPVAVVKRTGELNEEGYVNVADQLGISDVRDVSTYYRNSRSWGGGRSRWGTSSWWGRRR